ncbi:hypothetical protein ANN_05284 [Periplaneta americana]|uniref:Reverse transcriptase domain-containing protein n=1 Tax=Periplaneta americana TaxID=6978 RepID=A0ABQ8TD81_PERAM|nr:hypothetical protein ANN_05284 [Periplaneta americana]
MRTRTSAHSLTRVPGCFTINRKRESERKRKRAEQSDGITVFRISPIASLMLHRCRTGAISLQSVAQTTTYTVAMTAIDLSSSFVPISQQRDVIVVHRFEKHQILSKNQFGFRNNISTDDALINVTGKIINELDIGNKCLGIFLDLRKAFDTINHNLLLDKLHTIGVRESVVSMIGSSAVYSQSDVPTASTSTSQPSTIQPDSAEEGDDELEEYRREENDQLRTQFHSLLAMAFVPDGDILEAFDPLVENVADLLSIILNYVEDTISEVVDEIKDTNNKFSLQISGSVINIFFTIYRELILAKHGIRELGESRVVSDIG